MSQNRDEVFRGRNELLMLMAGEWLARAGYVATKLQVAALLDSGAKSIQELASQTQTQPESLQRLLRVLVSAGVFAENADGTFSNNATSAMLSRNHPETLYHLILFYAEFVHIAWEELLPSIQQGIPAFELVTHLPQFEYGKVNPAKGDLFQKAMKEKSRAVAESVLTAFDFRPYKNVCDLGGGYGHFMMALLAHHPEMRGTVFELPEVIETIKSSQSGYPKDRCQLIAGDFFEKVPVADAYLMKSVLHDWNDEKAVAILKNCHKVITKEGRILLVEIVLMPGRQSTFPHCMDLLMLAIAGGKERRLDAWKEILDRGGFEFVDVYSTATEFSVIEGRKK